MPTASAKIGQLTASIAHEVQQPIAATVAPAQAALRWLGAQLEEVRKGLARIVRDGNRVGDVTGRIRGLIEKAPPRRDALAINEAILEVIALLHGEVVKHGVSVQTQLAEGLPRIQGDRVQLPYGHGNPQGSERFQTGQGPNGIRSNPAAARHASCHSP
jgi:C4-dicarboxylate-specific signal transduction histidine kinase